MPRAMIRFMWDLRPSDVHQSTPNKKSKLHRQASSLFNWSWASYCVIKECILNSFKVNSHVMVRSRSAHVKVPYHGNSTDAFRNPFYELPTANVGTFKRFHSSNGRLGRHLHEQEISHGLTDTTICVEDHREPVLPFPGGVTKITKSDSRAMSKARHKSVNADMQEKEPHSIESLRDIATKSHGDSTTNHDVSGPISGSHKASGMYSCIFYQKPSSQVSRSKVSTKSGTKLHMEVKENANKDQNLMRMVRGLLPGHDRSQFSKFQSCNELTHQFQNLNVEELKHLAVNESKDTTQGIMNCLRLAENMTNEVAESLNLLQQQGEQTRRAHGYTSEIDHDLAVGEKVWESFGGIFSKTWKPGKICTIKGPDGISRIHSVRRKMTQSAVLVTGRNFRTDRINKSCSDSLPQAQLPWQAQVEIAEKKQDEALTDLSNVVSELKRMSLDMGIELSKQTGALDPFQEEVTELSQRLRRANRRWRSLLA